MQYRSWNPDKAVEDYYTRIRDHEKYYEPVEETTWPFIRIINVSVLALGWLYLVLRNENRLGRRSWSMYVRDGGYQVRCLTIDTS